MDLPGAGQARVDVAKITQYLLNPAHIDGAPKAEFFKRFGFDPDDPQVLADSLRIHAQRHQVARIMESPFGVRYTLEGSLDSPDGRNPRIRTVWIIERGSRHPRLVTAYPA